MIISHKRKFIFLKTRKTAGTSLEIALSQMICGKDDVITPIGEKDEEIRKKLGNNGPQKNYLININKYTLKDIWILLRHRRLAKFYNHMSAKETKQRIGKKSGKIVSNIIIVT